MTQTVENTKKMIIFHKFELPSLPKLLIKQNKNYWESNYMWQLFYFVQF